VGNFIRGGFFLTSLRRERSWDGELIRELHYIGELLSGALERKRAAEQMDEILRFERLLSEISATYINIPPAEIDKEIRKDLGRLGNLLGANRCLLYLLNEKKNNFSIDPEHGWWPEEDSERVFSNVRWMRTQPRFLDNFKYLVQKWLKGQHFQWNQLDKLPPEGERMQRAYAKIDVKSHLSIPISVGGATVGALSISDTRFNRKWPEKLIPRLRLFGEVFGNSLARKRGEQEIQKALSEVNQLKERIEADYFYLREEIKLAHNYEEIVGRSDALKYTLFKVEQVAPTDSTVLILGETGTGKELIARAIHNGSKRRGRPLIKLDCAALTPSLIESELFGHEKGAFTGAGTRRAGRFELADGATLFLDEIGELPLTLQPKLLRVLQDGEFERVGGSHTIKTNVRVIAATNRNLEVEMEEGKFRRDLWYRLNTFPISAPPLRKRLDDIPLLVKWFVNKYGNKVGKRFDMIPQKTMAALEGYSWPGNIRELENMIERAVITSEEGKLNIEVPIKDNCIEPTKPLEEFERDYVLKSLQNSGWIIEGPQGAAHRLGLKPSTLRNRMRKLHIRRPVN
jgi:transcriptional regulator with GAF, ATPase, and Fis domain